MAAVQQHTCTFERTFKEVKAARQQPNPHGTKAASYLYSPDMLKPLPGETLHTEPKPGLSL